MDMTVHNLVQLIPDCTISFLFLRTVEGERRPGTVKAVFALLALFATIALYLPINVSSLIFRFSYRAVCYFAFMRLWYGVSWKRCAYFSLFACACWTACQNILLNPLLFPIVQSNMSFSAHLVTKELVSMSIRIVCMAVPLGIVSRLAPFRNMPGPGLTQWAVIAVTIICEMYAKQSMNIISRLPEEQPTESSLFPIFLQLFLLGFIAFFERSLYSSKQQREIRMQEIVNHYRLRNLESKQLGDTDLRQLHHDMKNHLLAIRTLAQEESSISVDRYISSLLQGMQSYERYVETGSSVLNGLFSQKLAEAERNSVEMDLIIDFHRISFIEDLDLCTLFGNAVDNALEACESVPQGERQVTVRAQEAAGQLIITVCNTYCGEIHFADGLPRTSKSVPEEHGIGLRNIQRALKKYGGVMDIDLERAGWFKLTMLIPLPQGK